MIMNIPTMERTFVRFIQLDCLIKQLRDLVATCSVKTSYYLEFRLVHDILFREVELFFDVLMCHKGNETGTHIM